MQSAKFLEMANVVPIVMPLDLDTDRTGDYVSLANYGKVVFLFVGSPGTAGDDPTITLYEAQNVGGTGAQVLAAIDEYWTKQAATDLTSTGTFTKSTQTAASTLAGNATSAEQAKVYAFEIDAEDLSDGFTAVRADVALAASGGAQYGTLVALLLDPRHPQATGVSAIVD